LTKETANEQGKRVQGPPEGLVIEELRDTAKAPSGPPKTAFERLQQMVSTMKTTARSEQMVTERELQSALSLASEKVGDAQRMEQIAAQIDKVIGSLHEGSESVKANPASFLRPVEQLRTKIGEQQLMAGATVTRSLQQAVAAMAEAQAAMMQGAALTGMAAQVKEFEESTRLLTGVGTGSSGSGPGSSGSGQGGQSSGGGQSRTPDKDKESRQLPIQ
jgi:uncharacterized membrane protein YgcG